MTCVRRGKGIHPPPGTLRKITTFATKQIKMLIKTHNHMKQTNKNVMLIKTHNHIKQTKLKTHLCRGREGCEA